jgi:hypothetical protein
MKGFVYLLEIAIAAILMVVVLSTFFAIRVKQSWESSDLIDFGNNMLNYIKQNDSSFVKILDRNFTEIEKIKLANIGYGMSVRGSPKSTIIVGYAQFEKLQYIESLLTDAYLNGRWISFDVQEFNIEEGVPHFLDTIVLVNYTKYTTYKAQIMKYLNNGGVVVGINATYSDNQDFKDIFGLQNLGTSISGNNYFTSYDPETEDIEKYFMGIGFNLSTEWYIWEDRWLVYYIDDAGVDKINITKPDMSDFRYRGEGETFDLTGPDGQLYSFKVKEIWPSDEEANVQVLDTGFVFRDFEESLDFEGNQNVVSLPSGEAEMTSNGSAIWISDFPYSSEYEALVKAAIISRSDDWVAKGVFTERETTTVSSFFSLCCDMPETTELEITLWYIV